MESRSGIGALTLQAFFVLALCGPLQASGYGASAGLTHDVKVYAFIVKKQGLSDAEFHSHWRNPHGELTKKVPQINRYLQNHGVANPATLTGLPSMPCLGIATIWVADVGKLDDIFHDPGFQEVHADELNLLDREQLSWMITQEAVVADGARAGDIKLISTKALIFLKRMDGVTPEAFSAVVASSAATAAETFRGGRITYALPLPAAYTGETKPPYDAAIEIALRGDAGFQRAWSKHGAALLHALGAVANMEASRGFLAHEERVIWPQFE
jgi:uncharacterized protein (TIGR02118 family)